MRQLLLAALGAAGSLLMDLPALAQLSNATSTFSGQVTAVCELNLPENISLEYQPANWLRGVQNFDLTANISPVTLHVSPAVVVNEPPPYASAITATTFVIGSDFIRADKVVEGSKAFNVNTSSSNTFNLRFEVATSSMAGGSRFELPPGDYSYRVTISCLQ